MFVCNLYYLIIVCYQHPVKTYQSFPDIITAMKKPRLAASRGGLRIELLIELSYEADY
jgi:hypothetical protein